MDDTIYELTDVISSPFIQRIFTLGFISGFVVGVPTAITFTLLMTWLLS
jgi:hypothetical protein